MSSLRIRRGVVGCALAGLVALTLPDSSHAMAIGCAERGASFRHLDTTTGVLEIKVDANDAITWQAASDGGKVLIDIGSGWQDAIAPGSFRVTKGLSAFRIRIKGKGASTRVSCYPSDSKENAGITTEISASSQTNATSIGVGLNIKSRFGGTKNIVSQDMVFVSTSNMGSGRFLPPDWNLWATLEGRGYSGGMVGNSFDLVAGVDKLVGPDLIVGVLGGWGRTFVTVSGTYETSASPMMGAYFGQRLGTGLMLDGFLSYAVPGYATNGAAFNASRVSAGLNLTGLIERGSIDIEPFLNARGYQEAQPGYTAGGGAVIAPNTATAIAASAGVRVQFRGDGSGLVPYFSAAADMKRSTTTIGGIDLFTAPRVAFGLHGNLGRGRVSLDIDMGRTRSDTIDRGIKLGYEIKF
jgi:hypothetical protein